MPQLELTRGEYGLEGETACRPGNTGKYKNRRGRSEWISAATG